MYYVSEKMEGGVAATMANCTANGSKVTKLNERSFAYEKTDVQSVMCGSGAGPVGPQCVRRHTDPGSSSG